MALAANALTTLAVLKDELGITGSSEDSRLERYVSMASEAIEQYLNRRLQKVTVTDERVKPSRTRRITLKRTPIVTLTSVSVDGTSVDTDGITIENAAAGILYRESAEWSAADLFLEGSTTPDVLPGSGLDDILVTYVGGYVLPNDAGTRNLPYDIEEACVRTCTAIYRGRGRDPSVASESLGDHSVSLASPNMITGLGAGGLIPTEVLPLLKAHRRPVIA